MASAERLRIFVSRSSSDPQAEDVLDVLRDRFDVIDSISIASDLQPPLATRSAMAESEVVVVALPPPSNRDRSNVILDAGIAVGHALPTVVVSRESKLPRSLLGLPLVESAVLDDLPAVVANAAKTGETIYSKLPSKNHRHSPKTALPPVGRVASQVPDSRDAHDFTNEAEVLDSLRTVLINSGIKFLQPERSPGEAPRDRADLVVWDDALQHMFGLPLPIEITRYTQLSKTLRSHLRHTLRASGARSLVAVGVRGESCYRWSDGHELILTVPADDLARHISEMPFHLALASLLEKANIA